MNRSPAIPQTQPAPQRAVAIGATGLGVACVVGYFVALHLLIVDHTMASLTLMVIAGPWLVAAASSCAKAMAARPASRVGLTVLLFAIAMSLVARCGDVLHDRVDSLAYVENLVFVLSLAGLFASSLFGPREALVTRFARIAHGDMPPVVVRYTRGVTLAWAVFFAAAALVSTLLFALAPRATWSAFVNLALWPLTALGFGIEYAIRVRALPQIEHTSPFAGARAFMQRERLDAKADAAAREHG